MHGFPAGLTSFVGRQAALRKVAGLVARYRLVTVTGPGGSGKTRLESVIESHASHIFDPGRAPGLPSSDRCLQG